MKPLQAAQIRPNARHHIQGKGRQHFRLQKPNRQPGHKRRLRRMLSDSCRGKCAR